MALAVITFQRPHILIMDEPSNHLDLESLDSLIMPLNSFQGGVLVVTHDARLVSSVCETIVVCEHGRVAEFKGEYEEYRKQMLTAVAMAIVVLLLLVVVLFVMPLGRCVRRHRHRRLMSAALSTWTCTPSSRVIARAVIAGATRWR